MSKLHDELFSTLMIEIVADSVLLIASLACRGLGTGHEWRTQPAWEGGDLKHVKFVMLKENMDTQVMRV